MTPTDRIRRATPDWIIRPFQTFFRTEATGGILLLICAVVAFAWANSPWAGSYFALWETKLTVGVPGAELSKALQLWINDGLMALFFLLVGLEIKRELLVGELSSGDRAALPLAAAAGGMVVPALIFVAFNAGLESLRGWAIPMATDIAFALGVLALLGSRVPTALKVFLAALAIVDDLGAVLVIAFFYTAELSLSALGAAAGIFAVLMLLNRLGVRRVPVYLLLGAVLWLAVLKSGVHATVAGVLLAIAIPARRRIDLAAFQDQVQRALDYLREEADSPGDASDAIHSLEQSAEAMDTPLNRLEHALLPLSNYFIMPVFALANAGVALTAGSVSGLTGPAGIGIVAGLFLGKQIGIMSFAWAASKLGIARLPAGVNWRHIHGVSLLCGIGFTMALFITGLAYPPSGLADGAKLAILVGSLLSGVVGWVVLSRAEVPSGARQERAATSRS